MKNFLGNIVSFIKRLVKAFRQVSKPTLPEVATPVPPPVVELPVDPVKPVETPVVPPVVEPPVVVVPPVVVEPVVPPVIEVPKPDEYYTVTNATPIGVLVDIGDCSNGMVGDNAIVACRLVDVGLIDSVKGNSFRFGVNRNEATVFRFNSGNTPWLTIGYSEHTSRGCSSPRFVTLSEKFGDFDYSKIGVDGGYKAMVGDDSLLCGPSGEFPYVKLKPNTAYYLNIRYEDAREGRRGKLAAPCGVVGQTVGFN